MAAQWLANMLHTAAGLVTKKHPGTGDPTLDVIYSLVSLFLVLFAGLMSGLTLALMSLDNIDLFVLQRSGTAREKFYAEQILKVVSKPHQLLVTLLIGNAVAAEALPIFLDRLFNPVSAVIMSVTVVLIFGEIVPQAVCQRYGLAVGAYCTWVVRLLMVFTYPVARPISWVLDRVLGENHTALFRRAQLKALVEVHEIKEQLGGELSLDEVRVITGALDATEKTAKVVMTPLRNAFMLPADAVLDESTLMEIVSKGHSRIPVHRPGKRDEVLGVLLTKDLLLVDKDGSKTIASCKVRTLPILPEKLPLYDLLKLFETGRSHMAVLVRHGGGSDSDDDEAMVPEGAGETCVGSASSSGRYLAQSFLEQVPEGGNPQGLVLGYNCMAVGIVTLEDVIEELLQQEIVDETDTYVDNLRTKRINAALIMRNLPKHLRKLALTQMPRIGTVIGLDYTQGTHDHLRQWHRSRSLSSLTSHAAHHDNNCGDVASAASAAAAAVQGEPENAAPGGDGLRQPLLERTSLSGIKRWHN